MPCTRVALESTVADSQTRTFLDNEVEGVDIFECRSADSLYRSRYIHRVRTVGVLQTCLIESILAYGLDTIKVEVVDISFLEQTMFYFFYLAEAKLIDIGSHEGVRHRRTIVPVERVDLGHVECQIIVVSLVGELYRVGDMSDGKHVLLNH